MTVEPMTTQQIEDLRRITEEVGPGMTDWLSSGRTLELLAAYDLLAATTDEPGLRAAVEDIVSRMANFDYDGTEPPHSGVVASWRDTLRIALAATRDMGPQTPVSTPAARHDAESPVGSLDVERLARALRTALFVDPDSGEIVGSFEEVAASIAAEYARLTELEQE